MISTLQAWLSKIGKARFVILLGVLAILALVVWWFLGWLWALGGLGFGAGAAIREAQKAHEKATEQAIQAERKAADVEQKAIHERTAIRIKDDRRRIELGEPEEARDAVLEAFGVKGGKKPDA